MQHRTRLALTATSCAALALSATVVSIPSPGHASGGPTQVYVCAQKPERAVVTLNDSAGAFLILGSEEFYLDFADEDGFNPEVRGFTTDVRGTTWSFLFTDNQLSYRRGDDIPRACVYDGEIAGIPIPGEEAQTQDFVSAFGNFSLGGNVRSGPGMDHDVTDGLPFGEPVALVSRTGVIMNGFEWFEIEYSEGLRGYQWGGIMCSNALHIIGLYDPCPDDLPQ